MLITQHECCTGVPQTDTTRSHSETCRFALLEGQRTSQDLCDLHLPHRADQVIDCVQWNVGSLKRSQQILVSLWFFRLNILNHHVSDQQILNMITLKCVLRLKKVSWEEKKNQSYI